MKVLEVLNELEWYIKDYGCSNGTLDLVDNIRKELEELNNRSCRNCNLLTTEIIDIIEDDIPEWAIGKCTSVGHLYRRNVSPDFYCSFWKPNVQDPK